MKKLSIALLMMMAALFMLPGCTDTTEPESSVPKVLIFAKTNGFYHNSIERGMIVLMDLCDNNNIFATGTRDSLAFTPENLAQYNLVVFLNTTRDVLDSTQQVAFEDYIHAGGGYLGIHAATDTEYDWPWYGKLAGAWFNRHPMGQPEATMLVTDKSHPATAMLPDEWVRSDEWYEFKDMSPDIKVLAYLDESTYEGGEMGENHPFIWYQEDFEGGRSFYTGVGHLPENFDEPLVQEHLIAAIKWAGKIDVEIVNPHVRSGPGFPAGFTMPPMDPED